MSTTPSDDDRPQAKRSLLEEFRPPEPRTIQGGEGSEWSDARSIREDVEGLGAYNPSSFKAESEAIVEDMLELTHDPGPDRFGGGTDCLATGKPGTGKSTLANHLAVRSIEINDAKLVWRGSPSRSEWLPLAPWTTLCLPAEVEIEAEFVPRDPTDETIRVSLDELEEHVVREIKRYRDPSDLNQRILTPGAIHVVYPDPQMRGLEAIYRDSEEKRYQTPDGRDQLFAAEDPSNHWWFGWVLARVEHGPHDWTTLILDEIGDIAPESARKDAFGTYQKIELLRDCWVDARKMGLSIFAFGHSEADIHNMVRRKLRWRIQMNQSSNPTSASDVIGFKSVPMNTDLTSGMEVGEALVYTENNFNSISWPAYPTPVSHKLKIKTVGVA